MQENIDSSSSSSSNPKAMSDPITAIAPITENPESPNLPGTDLSIVIESEHRLAIYDQEKEKVEKYLNQIDEINTSLTPLYSIADIDTSIASLVKSDSFAHSQIASLTKDFQNREASFHSLLESNPNFMNINRSMADLATTLNSTWLPLLEKTGQFGISVASISKEIFENLDTSLISMAKGILDNNNSWASLIKNAFESSSRSMATWAEGISKQFQAVNFASLIPKPDPIWGYVFDAKDGDIEAARKLATRIRWSPDKFQRDALKIRAKIEGCSPEEIRIQALTQGVLRVLSFKEDDKLPVLVQPVSAWIQIEQKTIMTINPGELTFRIFWDWMQEEAAHAAGLWLIEQPYAPSFVVTEPPTEYYDLRLFKFTSSSDKYRLESSKGRPIGSGTFENREAFLSEIRMAVTQIRGQGNKVTQESVTAALSIKGVLGLGNPERQLRAWVHDFGFENWQTLRKNL